MGFFTDTTVCIGCKACEVACKQWNDLPADGSDFGKGRSLDHTGSLSASSWRHVHFVEIPPPDDARPASAHGAGGGAAGGRAGPLAVRVRRLQALHERRLPRRLPDRRADPDRVRDRDRPVRHLQRLRLLRHRRARSASSTATPTTGGPPSARSVTTACRTASSPRARRPARPTRSSSARTTSSSSARSGASWSCTSAASRRRTSTAPATRARTSSRAGSARSSC